MRPLAVKFQTPKSAFYKTVLLIAVWSWSLCVILFPYSLVSSGFCFMPWPRFCQYWAGVFLARFFVDHLTNKSYFSGPDLRTGSSPDEILFEFDSTPRSRHIDWQSRLFHWGWPFMADILFCLYLAICVHGYQHARYSAEWRVFWVWKTLGVTPIFTVIIFFLLMQAAIIHYREALWFHSKSDGQHTVEYNRKLATAIAANKMSLVPKLLFKVSWFFSLLNCRWIQRAAPGMTNMVAFLLHFPMAFQLYFDKNTLYLGTGVLHYLMSLWILSIIIGKYIFPKVAAVFVGNTFQKTNK